MTPDPRAWVHAHAFDEVADAVAAGLAELGHRCVRAHALQGSGVNILFGAHHLPADVEPPASTIFFNLEQVIPGAIWLTPQYLERLRRFPVWDYSALNVAALRELGVSRVTHVPVGHARSLERIVPQAEDIDVLFYGIVNERRVSLLRRLAARGWSVHAVNGVYAEERDRLIARARIVINIHYYENARLEVARCFYLLANGRFILSEHSVDAEASGLSGGMAFAAYEELEERCAWFLSQAQERSAIARAGRELMRARPQSAFLATALAQPGMR